MERQGGIFPCPGIFGGKGPRYLPLYPQHSVGLSTVGFETVSCIKIQPLTAGLNALTGTA